MGGKGKLTEKIRQNNEKVAQEALSNARRILLCNSKKGETLSQNDNTVIKKPYLASS